MPKVFTYLHSPQWFSLLCRVEVLLNCCEHAFTDPMVSDPDACTLWMYTYLATSWLEQVKS